MSTWCRSATRRPGSSDPFVREVSPATGDRARRLRHEGRGGRDPAAVATASAAGQRVPTFAVHFVVGRGGRRPRRLRHLAPRLTPARCIIPEPTTRPGHRERRRADVPDSRCPAWPTHGSTRVRRVIGRSTRTCRSIARWTELEARRNAIVEPMMDDCPIPYPLSVGRLRAGDWSQQRPGPGWSPRAARASGSRRTRPAPGGAGARGADRGQRRTRSCATIRRCHLARRPVRGGRLPAGHAAWPIGWPRCTDTGHRRADRGPGRAVRQRPAAVRAGRHPDAALRPGDARQAHAPNESVPIDQLRTAAEVLTRSLLQADQLAAVDQEGSPPARTPG